MTRARRWRLAAPTWAPGAPKVWRPARKRRQNREETADSTGGSAVDEATNEASLIGNTLGDRYRLIEVIGEGGMGRVYRAEQLATGKAVALKLLHPEFVGVDQVVRRFEREAKVMTEVAHPGIVKVIELGEWNGRLFLAMELLAGKSLASSWCGKAAQEARGAADRQADARDHASRPRGAGVRARAGRGAPRSEAREHHDHPGRPPLAREHQAARLRDREAGGSFRAGVAEAHTARHGAGNAAYMAPEQAAGQEADVRSDVYSSGSSSTSCSRVTGRSKATRTSMSC